MNRFAAAALLLVLCASSAARPAPPPAAAASNLIFLESGDAMNRLPRNKIATSLSELVRALNLDGKDLPRVLVLHMAPQNAKVVGVRQNALRHNTGAQAGDYYELWIIGDSDPIEYTAAFEQMLERHFALRITDAERKRVLTRVLRLLDATVDAHGQ